MVGLSVEGHEDIFEVSPKIINRRGTFVISIKSNKKLDYETTKSFHFKVLTPPWIAAGLDESCVM